MPRQERNSNDPAPCPAAPSAPPPLHPRRRSPTPTRTDRIRPAAPTEPRHDPARRLLTACRRPPPPPQSQRTPPIMTRPPASSSSHNAAQPLNEKEHAHRAPERPTPPDPSPSGQDQERHQVPDRLVPGGPSSQLGNDSEPIHIPDNLWWQIGQGSRSLKISALAIIVVLAIDLFQPGHMNLNPAVEGHDHPLNAVRTVDFGVDFSTLARPEGAAARVAGPARGRGGIS